MRLHARLIANAVWHYGNSSRKPGKGAAFDRGLLTMSIYGRFAIGNALGALNLAQCFVIGIARFHGNLRGLHR